ncbi:peptidylprolyl isomerase [Fodinicurvata fenggangensis]|uniref:peptidylprolyl isomerase n=1 Tax=Fodinicurvata fenggangensis TaxID=1121830 RepID=UPI0006905B07|nr:peptidylprolyl isomerase [Fodinicurvata fenggangensis]
MSFQIPALSLAHVEPPRASRRLLSALTLAAFLSAGTALLPGGTVQVQAQDNAAEQSGQAEGAGFDPDRVLATVNGKDVTMADVIATAQDLPQQYQSQLSSLFPALVERLIDFKLLEEAGREEGLADNEQVREAVERAESEAIGQIYLQQAIDEAATDERLQDAYTQYKADFEAKKEVQARHILVEEKEQAEELIAELDAGADFAALADEHSMDEGTEGGDLGYFTQDRMVEPFADAAFEMESGSYSKEPVETEFGWHVIKVEDSRMTEPPEMSEVRGELEQQIASEAIEEILADLRADADIEMKGTAPQSVPEDALEEEDLPETGTSNQ